MTGNQDPWLDKLARRIGLRLQLWGGSLLHWGNRKGRLPLPDDDRWGR